MRIRPVYLLAVTLAIVDGCHRVARTDSAGPALNTAIAGSVWMLVELDGHPAPTGAAGRRATLHFDTAAPRASGFAGCIRYTAGYTISGDSLRFKSVAVTRIVCTEGMDLEPDFTAMLAETQRFHLASDTFTLVGAVGPVAPFSRNGP